MRTKKEIMEYLGIDCEDKEKVKLWVDSAKEIERKYKEQLKTGNYGYGLACDLEVQGRLEDNIYSLIEIVNINDIILYKKELDKESLNEIASDYHMEDLIEELNFYQWLADKHTELKPLYDEAVKEICDIFKVNYVEWKTGIYNFEENLECDSSEFLLELVNNIADYLKIDNHLYF